MNAEIKEYIENLFDYYNLNEEHRVRIRQETHSLTINRLEVYLREELGHILEIETVVAERPPQRCRVKL